MRPVIRELCLTAMTVVALAGPALAKNVKVDMTVKEVELDVDNKGTKQKMWTYGGSIPGPLVRVTQGDVVEFTLTNDAANKNSHSMDFHAAVVDVLDEFAEVKPGGTKKFTFEAKYPGVFIYHCGASAMVEHISRGMYGVIIVDPKGSEQFLQASFAASTCWCRATCSARARRSTTCSTARTGSAR